MLILVCAAIFTPLRGWAARGRLAIVSIAALVGVLPSTASAGNRPMTKEEEEEAGIIDPRRRPIPRTHRFRLGFEIDYIRLSAAYDEDSGETQRFHWLPLQLDFAYQAQFLKYLMIRPSLAIGANVANSIEAMPLTVHPQLHFGYQGGLFGAAFGYGWFTPPIQRKDARSEIRGGLGQPIITNNHHIGIELSFTTRIHPRRPQAPGAGELSFQIRVGGVNSRTQHFDLNARRWRMIVMFNAGWYFGDGRRARQRRAQRQRERALEGR
jgi:hypothetical protein